MGAALQLCCPSFSLQQVLLLQSMNSRVSRLQELQHTDLVALQHVGSSQTRDRTHVPCTGRQIPSQGHTREALLITIKNPFTAIPTVSGLVPWGTLKISIKKKSRLVQSLILPCIRALGTQVKLCYLNHGDGLIKGSKGRWEEQGLT